MIELFDQSMKIRFLEVYFLWLHTLPISMLTIQRDFILKQTLAHLVSWNEKNSEVKEWAIAIYQFFKIFSLNSDWN